jgi:hypothetical protein
MGGDVSRSLMSALHEGRQCCTLLSGAQIRCLHVTNRGLQVINLYAPIVAHGPLGLVRQAPSNRTTMNVTLELWCIVSGDSRPFTVSISTHDNISVLKERIYEKNKNGFLRDIDAKDLKLWKVSSFYQFLRFSLCTLMVRLWLTPLCFRLRRLT